jgi:hypothetical protein
MALLLQKQEDTNKDPTAPTITAVGSCSSSSEGGGTPVHPGSRSSTASPAGSKPNKVAALIRSISGKALRRSASKKDVAEPGHSTIAVHAGGLSAAGAVPHADDAADSAARDLELGTFEKAAPVQLPPHPSHEAGSLPRAAQAASAPAAAMHHSASAPGPLTRPGTPGIVTPGIAAAALGRLSPGALARPSAASVWREAGWDAAGGVPVGVITLEDVLEELMQVCGALKRC